MRLTVAVAAWIGSANSGDQLIFAALRRKLLDRGVHVTAISSAPPHGTAARGVAQISNRSPAALRAVRSGAALVFGGGGLLQDHTSAFNLPYHLATPAAAAALRTPCAVVGIGAGPLHTAVGRAQVRYALRAAVAISARDEHSVAVLRTAGVSTVRLAADLAVSLPSPRSAPRDVICACLRPWRAERYRLPVRMRRPEAITAPDMIGRLARGLDEAAGRLGMPVQMVAMQPGFDDVLHRQVAERMRAPVTLVNPRSQHVVELISASRVVVAMRYHAAVAALLAGRPATLIGYDPKMTGLADALGPAGRLLPWTPQGLDGLGAAIADFDDHADRLPAVLAELRHREQVNDTVLDDLLERAEVVR